MKSNNGDDMNYILKYYYYLYMKCTLTAWTMSSTELHCAMIFFQETYSLGDDAGSRAECQLLLCIQQSVPDYKHHYRTSRIKSHILACVSDEKETWQGCACAMTEQQYQKFNSHISQEDSLFFVL